MSKLKYIISLEFGEGSRPYYIRDNGETWDEIYNPNFATQFDTKKLANDWHKQNTTFSEYVKVITFENAIKQFEGWQEHGMIRRTFDKIDNSISRKYNGESPDEVLAWWIASTKLGDDIRYQDYKTWPKLYDDQFDYLWDIETYNNVDYTEKYLTFQLVFRPTKKSYHKFLEEFEKTKVHGTRKNDAGYLIYSVFDHYLCEGGNYVELFYRADDDCHVSSRWNTRVAGTLKDCFEYLHKERYYDE